MRLLQRRGFYAELCPDSDVGDCDAAKLKYNAIFTAASAGTTAGALVFGLVFDRIGPRYTSILGHALLVLGMMLLTFSTQSRKLN